MFVRRLDEKKGFKTKKDIKKLKSENKLFIKKVFMVVTDSTLK